LNERWSCLWWWKQTLFHLRLLPRAWRRFHSEPVVNRSGRFLRVRRQEPLRGGCLFGRVPGKGRSGYGLRKLKLIVREVMSFFPNFYSLPMMFGRNLKRQTETRCLADASVSCSAVIRRIGK
jgi:hypothetical protein